MARRGTSTSLLVLPVAARDFHLDRPGGRHLPERLHVLHPQHAQIGDVRQRGHRQNMGDLFRIYPKMAEIDPVAVPMKAVIAVSTTPAAHGAGCNMTRGRRIAMTSGYMRKAALSTASATSCRRIISTH